MKAIINEEVVVLQKQISWTAIAVGVLVCIGLSFLLNLFSLATGLSLVTTDKTGMATLAIGGFVGMAIGIVACMFVAGFVAGMLGQPYNPRRNLGVLYGFATWSLALIITVILAAQMGRYVSFYSHTLTHSKPAISVSMDRSVYHKNIRGSLADVKVNTALPAEAKRDKNIVDPNTEKAANALGMTSFLVFILFFLGAFASCIGGYCGMTCECRDKNKYLIS